MYDKYIGAKYINKCICSRPLHTLKPMVINEQLLCVEAFDSVITSMANKHQVDMKHL